MAVPNQHHTSPSKVEWCTPNVELFLVILTLEQSSIECKTSTKVMTPANHKGHRQELFLGRALVQLLGHACR